MTPILLVPGLVCTAEVFAPQAVALWPYGPVTIASTLNGRSMRDIAAAILADAPPRFALAGISMGGYISFEILRQAPERVLKLALLDTSARPDTPEQTAARRGAVERAKSGDFAALLEAITTSFLHPAHRDDAGLRDINVRMGLSVGVEGFARQTEAIIGRVDSRPSLAAIAVPTLVLVGDADPLTPVELSKEIAAGIPQAKLVVIEDCGHGSTLEQPAAVNRQLVDWISAA
ncbi:alpha/beta fold hydrolase [Pleomorphomonas sp. PLEO]|uniref:alpha/beta fold hydrolase n=1 Tax=Pleomorphomonas sp. PLEO TaxID=3239306 RepID=UPI00351E5396